MAFLPRSLDVGPRLPFSLLLNKYTCDYLSLRNDVCNIAMIHPPPPPPPPTGYQIIFHSLILEELSFIYLHIYICKVLDTFFYLYYSILPTVHICHISDNILS